MQVARVETKDDDEQRQAMSVWPQEPKLAETRQGRAHAKACNVSRSRTFIQTVGKVISRRGRGIKGRTGERGQLAFHQRRGRRRSQEEWNEGSAHCILSLEVVGLLWFTVRGVDERAREVGGRAGNGEVGPGETLYTVDGALHAIRVLSLFPNLLGGCQWTRPPTTLGVIYICPLPCRTPLRFSVSRARGVHRTEYGLRTCTELHETKNRKDAQSALQAVVARGE